MVAAPVLFESDIRSLPRVHRGKVRDSYAVGEDKLLLVTTFIVLTLPGLGLANRLPIWLTVCIISRDVVIVLTVAIVNLAIGRRTFYPSMFGKIATATYILTAVVAMLFNYLGYRSMIVDVFVYGSLTITLLSSLHYIWHAARIIDEPAPVRE